MPKTKKFLIIDANSLIHRAYHALPPLTTKDGRLVNAVYGFANIFLKVIREHDPDYLAVCFDMAGPTFRDEIYEEYKAGREEKPQEFYDQFDIIKDLLEAMRVPVFEKEGYEADDIIGTMAKLIIPQKSKVRSIILTGDKDMLQLVDGSTEVEMAKKGVSETVVYSPSMVEGQFGFAPEQIVDYKALRGDPSDNIPGVKGIGDKTATALIKEFGTIEKLYQIIKKSTKQKINIKDGVLKKLVEHEDDAKMSKELATINIEVPIKVKLEDLEVKEIDRNAVVAIIQDLGFKSLLKRLPKTETASLFDHENMKTLKHKNKNTDNYKQKKAYNLIDSKEKFDAFIEELDKQKIFAIDTETTSLDTIDAELLGISFSWKAGEGYYIPNYKLQNPNNKQFTNSKFQIQNKKLLSILENPSIKKIGHNIKYDYEVLKQAGINIQGITFDTMIASYLLNPGSRSHSLSNLAFTELGVKMIEIEELIGKKGKDQLTMDQVPVEEVADYAAEDADITWRLYEKLSKDADLKKLKKVFEDLEMPLVTILGDMELRGVKINSEFLKKLSKKLESKIKNLESRILKLAGEEFNVASPKQLKEILFEKMKISTEGLSRTKTGVSTAASELEKLKGKYEIVDHIMDFRELSKLKNTYTDALPKLINKKTNRVHTSYNQTITATGRLSSSDPNLQNIPIRTELGAQIRNAFIADRGYSMVAIDYSQIELRIVASLSGDTVLTRAFEKGEDVHSTTAANIFDKGVDTITPDERRKAKIVNFGILYGLGARGLARDTDMNTEEAREFLDKYFTIHKKVKTFIEETKEFAFHEGYTETLLGRRRYFPEIRSEHPMLRSQAERAAINLPVQGLSADIIKIAMKNIEDEIKKQKWETEVKMIMQVHDELVFEIKNSLVDESTKMIKEIMENAYILKVPIVVDVGVGKNWGEAK